jgi:chromosome partitioning protein
MHIAVAIARAGRKVFAIDLDGRQRSFARYIENRVAFCERTGRNLPTPEVEVIERSKGARSEADADESARLNDCLTRAREKADFVVIDTPGNDTTLSRLGHAAADTLVTPLNDSFLDFDLLAKFDPDTLTIKGPSLYAEFVWDCRKRRLMAHRANANIDWVVMRNRVPSAEMRNKRRVATAVEQLSTRIGCRVASGFSDRVIFRELFPMGLTMLDLPLRGLAMPLTMSHVAARQEVRELLAMLHLPGLEKPSTGA